VGAAGRVILNEIRREHSVCKSTSAYSCGKARVGQRLVELGKKGIRKLRSLDSLYTRGKYSRHANAKSLLPRTDGRGCTQPDRRRNV
jgi:hypothetical protein